MSITQDAAAVSLLGNSKFVLPNAVADTAAEVEANLDYVLSIMDQDRPGHDIKIPLDIVGHPGFVFVTAMLLAVKASIP